MELDDLQVERALPTRFLSRKAEWKPNSTITVKEIEPKGCDKRILILLPI